MNAQNQPRILLTDHTFSDGKKEIGKVHLINYEGLGQLKLTGSTADRFTLRKGVVSHKGFSADEKRVDLALEATTRHGTARDTFRIVRDEFLRNKVIAHRGAWKNTATTENSMVALRYAIQLGCQGSELDIHMSSDSVLFVNHDPTIEGLTIEQTPAAKLAMLKLSNGENLPTLANYLAEGIKQSHTKLVLEIKPTALGEERARFLAQSVRALVRKYKAEAWVDYISFDYTICKELVRIDPFARVAYLNGDRSPKQLASDKIWGLDYHHSVFRKNEHWIKEAQELRLTLNAWTVNDLETMQWLLDRNFDFITTNEPELLLKLVKQDKKSGSK